MKRVLILCAGALLAAVCGPRVMAQGAAPNYRQNRFARPFGPGFGGAVEDPARSSEMALLERSDVQDEVRVSGQQREQLQEQVTKAQQEYQDQLRQSFQAMRGLNPEARRQALQERRTQMQGMMQGYTAGMDKVIAKVLTPQQQKRLGELDLQWRGPLALGDSTVAEKVGLSRDQRTSVGESLQGYRTAEMDARRGTLQGMRFQRYGNGQAGVQGQPAPNQAEMQARFEAAQKEIDKAKQSAADKVLALLSPQQRATWDALVGRKFTFRLNQ